MRPRAKVFVVPIVRLLFLGSALLVFANVALADGDYQRTKDGKTFVWNNHPRPGDEATWSGGRDGDGYARGFGTLTWYTVDQKSETNSARPELYARFWGNMVRGKLDGPVNAHSKRRTDHAIFVNGERLTRWSAGPATSRSGARWRALARKSEDRSQRTEVGSQRSEENAQRPTPNAQRSIKEAQPEVPAEGPLNQRSEVTGQRSEDRSHGAEVGSQNSGKNAQRPTLNAQRSIREAQAEVPAEGPLNQRSENGGQKPEDSRLRLATASQGSQMPEVREQSPEASTQLPIRANAADVDDALRVLAWPPQSLGVRSVSKGPVQRANARLTREQVVDLADAAARSRGYDPTEYQREDPQYDPSDQAWSLAYDERPAYGTDTIGKHLSVAVGDKTKRTALVPAGETETAAEGE